MHDISVLFYLLGYADQTFEAGYLGSGLDDFTKEEEEEILKKYKAAVLVISDIWTNGNIKEAEDLINIYHKSQHAKFPSL